MYNQSYYEQREETEKASQPLGTTLLGIIAAGLIAYGFYMLIEARYHRIRAR